MTTPSEVWIPAFEWLAELTVVNTQGYQDPRTGKRWCVLCETPVSPSESENHVARHRAEREESPMSKNTNSNKNSTAKTEVPQELIDRMVKMAQDGMGITAIAKTLTDEKVPTPGKSKQWHPPVVRGYIMRATGVSGIQELRKKNPVVRPKAADEEPKPATRVGKKNGNGDSAASPDAAEASGAEAEKDEAKPDPKPASSSRKRGSRAKAAAKA